MFSNNQYLLNSDLGQSKRYSTIKIHSAISEDYLSEKLKTNLNKEQAAFEQNLISKFNFSKNKSRQKSILEIEDNKKAPKSGCLDTKLSMINEEINKKLVNYDLKSILSKDSDANLSISHNIFESICNHELMSKSNKNKLLKKIFFNNLKTVVLKNGHGKETARKNKMDSFMKNVIEKKEKLEIDLYKKPKKEKIKNESKKKKIKPKKKANKISYKSKKENPTNQKINKTKNLESSSTKSKLSLSQKLIRNSQKKIKSKISSRNSSKFFNSQNKSQMNKNVNDLRSKRNKFLFVIDSFEQNKLATYSKNHKTGQKQQIYRKSQFRPNRSLSVKIREFLKESRVKRVREGSRPFNVFKNRDSSKKKNLNSVKNGPILNNFSFHKNPQVMTVKNSTVNNRNSSMFQTNSTCNVNNININLNVNLNVIKQSNVNNY